MSFAGEDTEQIRFGAGAVGSEEAKYPLSNLVKRDFGAIMLCSYLCTPCLPI